MTKKNATRWIVASIMQYIDEHRDGLTAFLHGTHREPFPKDYIEVRFDGPTFTEASKDYYEISIVTNILILSNVDDRNFHRLFESMGKTLVTLPTNMEIYKYGKGVDDDQSLWFCMNREEIVATQFGTEIVRQASLETTYKGEVEMVN